MADISIFKAPDSTEYNFKDAISRRRLDVQTGAGTAGQEGSSSRAYVPSLWTFDLGMAPSDGDIITIKVPVDGVKSGVWMSVDNGENYYPVALMDKERCQTQYAAESILTLVYQENAETTVYGTDETGAAAGSSASDLESNRWSVLNYYDTNTAHDEFHNIVVTGSISMGRAAGSTVGAESVATGSEVTASGVQSHAEGYSTIASGSASHAEGYNTTALGANAHAEGYITTASGDYSHAEGGNTTSAAQYSHTEGYQTKASGSRAHAEGYGDPSATKTLNNQTYTGAGAHGDSAHSEGNKTWAIGIYSHAEGNSTVASEAQAHAEGQLTTASGSNSHAEGYKTNATASYSHSEGGETNATGAYSHAEGAGATASGTTSHAEGAGTIASGAQSHAEGTSTIAAGAASHAGGAYNVADSYANWNEWTANTSYEVGDKVKRTTGSGTSQTVTGYVCKTANSDASFTSSKWTNQSGKMNYVEIIGNGTSGSARSNARALDWEGNEYLKGDVYVGCNADSSGGIKLIGMPTAPAIDGTYMLQCVVLNGAVTYSWVSLPNAEGASF